MVNLHGSTIPRGWRREFPNLMTMEAVKGAEWYKIPLNSPNRARDHLIYPLSRNIVGPMDYTPLVFEESYKQAGLSYAHSLALGVLFESALQHFADFSDQPKKGYRKLFTRYPWLKDFLAELPCSWDESLLLAADPQAQLLVARRKAHTWYLAAITAEDRAWQQEFSLAALKIAKPIVKLVRIDSRSKKNALQISSKKISPQKNRLKLNLAANSGAVWKITF